VLRVRLTLHMLTNSDGLKSIRSVVKTSTATIVHVYITSTAGMTVPIAS
jgi:hypothetical protein